MQEQIRERLARIATSAPRKRPWYRRFWGKVLMMIGLVLGVLLIIFTIRVAQYYKQTIAIDPGTREFVRNLQQDARTDLLQNGNDPSIGKKDAKVTVVAFEDFECPFCKQAQPFIKKIVAKYGNDVRFIYKDFPLTSIHANAQKAAEAGQCAFEQDKFWEFHDILFENQDKLSLSYYRTAAREAGLNINEFNECFNTGKYRRSVTEDAELGRLLGVIGTPTFFMNGELLAQGYGPQLDEAFEAAIEYILRL